MTHEQLACQEQARNEGREHPDRAWICTFFDTWERNPYYAGPPVPHPEDDCCCWEAEDYVAAPEAQVEPMADPWEDDIPF
jgi:hypothetical protein